MTQRTSDEAMRPVTHNHEASNNSRNDVSAQLDALGVGALHPSGDGMGSARWARGEG